MQEDLIEYTIVDKNHVTVSDIQHEASIIWDQLHNPDSAAARIAVRHGIELKQLPDTLEEVLSIRPSGQGLDATTIAMIVAIVNSPAVSTIAKDIWKYVILAHIRDKFGDKAIEERKGNRDK